VSSPWRSTPIPGLFQTSRPPLLDSRGSFSKILGEGDGDGPDPFRTREIFWSRSDRGVFRGMHVQLPPRAARKLVFVTSGTVRDFVLDVRRGSPTEGLLWAAEMDGESGGLVIPEGCAHGFEVLSDTAVMVYAQEDFHSPEHDGGIHYGSAGVRLAAADPVVSARDLALPELGTFDSPFDFA
jgi:dTDP-4-dehydrorhamnose 3,5-epimerase